MTFQLDTSGHVLIGPHVPPTRPGSGGTLRVVWSDLSPFAQGYVEALFASLQRNAAGQPMLAGPAGAYIVVRFDMLHREALAMILGDCEAFQAVRPRDVSAYAGKCYWAWRQAGEFPPFPPLTVSLNDEGKVCLKPAGSDQ